MKITLNPRQSPQRFCVYRHKIELEGGFEVPIYTGYCRLSAVFSMTEPRRFEVWKEITDKYKRVIVEIIAINLSLDDAKAAATQFAINDETIVNQTPKKTPARQPIRRIIDNVTYFSVEECAKENNISVAILRLHLDRKANLMHIHGKRYEYA